MGIQRPLVLGLGGVGNLVALFLQKDLGMDVLGVDLQKGSHVHSDIPFQKADVSSTEELNQLMKGRDAVISCLPFFLTKKVAECAHANHLHYFDPTEDVDTTNMIRELSKNSQKVMIPQNGLAPGFIGILSAHIANQFDEGTLRHIKMRVGALPQNPIGLLGYSANWSLDGLVNEYIQDCDVIVNGKPQKVGALKNLEVLRIDGDGFEAFTTSGGLGTMAETYAGKVETLDYKSIRYPGHHDGVKLLIEELRFKYKHNELVALLKDSLPPDDQDRVLIHSSVQGHRNQRLQSKQIVADYKPILLHGQYYTAIAWTTAASIVSVVELVHKGILPLQGFVKQEDIPLQPFLETHTGNLFLQHNENLRREFGK